jgi:hypothetical protein
MNYIQGLELERFMLLVENHVQPFRTSNRINEEDYKDWVENEESEVSVHNKEEKN